MIQIIPLPPDLQAIAENELGEVPSRIYNDLSSIKTWIQQQPHLKARTDDQFLIQYLRCCKYSLENAKTKIDCLYTMKTKFPEEFNVNDVTNKMFRDIYRLMTTVALPIPLNNDGPRIVLTKTHDDLINGKYSLEKSFAVVNAFYELLLLDDPYACINGIVIIYDMKKITTNYLLKYTPSFLKKACTFYEKAMPFRFKGLYFINTPSFFQNVFNIAYPMLSEKIKKRIAFCGKNTNELLKYIPKMYLPIEYGGKNGSIDQVDWNFDKKWDEYRDYFKENINYGTNERLRLGKPIDFDSMFGLGGSFRKLDVD